MSGENPQALTDPNERARQMVERVMRIDDVTLGTAKQNFIVRYRGQLRSEDSAAAYDQLSEYLKPLGFTPLFRIEDGRHAVLLTPGRPEPKPSNPWINLALFIATLISVLVTGAFMDTTPWPTEPMQIVSTFFMRGIPFAVCMIAILGAHEFGHYLAGRHHGVQVTLPYFIPLPLSPMGTMGAFINMKSIPKNRNALMDIGVAGPLSGFVITIPVLLLGLSLSHLDPLPTDLTHNAGMMLEGNSLLYLLLKYVTFGKLLPEPLSFGNLNPILYWVIYFFSGRPFPLGGLDVLIHPVAWAGWAGMLVTGINLIPAGQLDGGHVTNILFGEKAMKRLFPIVLGALGLLGLAWYGWWLWAALIFLFGRIYAEPLDLITPLDPSRRLLGYITLLVALITFIPVPMIVF